MRNPGGAKAVRETMHTLLDERQSGQDTKKSNCVGFRVLWNRWMIGVERGNRKNMVVKQLLFKRRTAKLGVYPSVKKNVTRCASRIWGSMRST